MLSLTQQQRQQQHLVPQQIQYQKLLLLPVLALEQEIKEELELNPLLEEAPEQDTEEELPVQSATEGESLAGEEEFGEEEEQQPRREDDESWQELMPDDERDDDDRFTPAMLGFGENEHEEFLQRAPEHTLAEELLDQLRLLDLTERNMAIAEELVGNIDDHGYLRRDVSEIVDEINADIERAVRERSSERLEIQDIEIHHDIFDSYGAGTGEEPYGRERIIAHIHTTFPDVIPLLTVAETEAVLHRIQKLDPSGVGARDLRECLLLQLERRPVRSIALRLAVRILRDHYDDFAAKRFPRLMQALSCSENDLRNATEIIKGLNPKPGEGTTPFSEGNYVVPDFTVMRDGNELVITFNDQHIPALRINKEYREMLSSRNPNGLTSESKKYLRSKLDEAKMFIAAIRQRRHTLRNIMRGMVELQREFFMQGPDHIRPMVYRELGDLVQVDISTISRVVNGKYVQTDYGVFELRYFFSERLETADGEEVSTKLVKARIAQLIEEEDKRNPLSDDALTKLLTEAGFMVARRTVAKYREQLGLPVARLRKGI